MARSTYIYLLRDTEPPFKIRGAFTVKREAQGAASDLPPDSVTLNRMADGRLSDEYTIPWDGDPWGRGEK